MKSLLRPKKPFTTLLAVLVVFTMIGPALAAIESRELTTVSNGITIATLLLMFGVVFSEVAEDRRTRIITLVLAVPGLAMSVVSLTHPSPVTVGTNMFLRGGFLFFLVILILRYIFRSRRITPDLIAAALCAYLVLGTAWASLYGLIEVIQPGSFSVPDDGLGAFVDIDAERALQPEIAARRVYFSLVTLLTLGYGEIVPVEAIARLSAVMEAFVGQIFLVVLVAQLVSTNAAQSIRAGGEPSTEDGAERGGAEASG